MKLSKDFTKQEFACPHCGKVKVAEMLVSKLQQLRDIINKPIKITSGYRCPVENKKVGGAKNSAHLLGEGADIQVKGMSSAYIKNMPVILAIIASKIANIRIGIYPNHIHIDIVPPTPSKYWLVKKYGQKAIYSGNEKNLSKFLKNNS